ncbi:uncharacterized protein LOC101460297 isoform X4 [Ceratitis capitata]|uniref:(Mediterranean fruit fly) hypothetical protein n=1 Tax=Ceratitis capitata TaxID=7213 RepID=W8BX85_CERCA|nr:uncharacterized protein LOC101460297 isoform X4 [Ceratitis capitata]CAD7011927.1 unnamed protein product [Ceratitis capitata]
MNLMFRKHFREGGGGKSGGGGSKLQPKANRTKRSREMSGGQQEDIHYRTHLFFAPSRPGVDVGEERCTALSGACTQLSTTTTSLSLPPQQYEVDAPQPLVDRKPSISLLRWNNSVRERNGQVATVLSNAAAATTARFQAARQVNFDNGAGTSTAVRSEPISLSALDRDCFIIPVHSVDRFLPAGIPLPAPSADGKTNSPLSILEVSDPKLCILVHLMSPLEPIDPMLESPLSHPLLKQRAVAAELVSEVQQANTAVGGMLLANMEKNADFPFISYYLINTTQTDPSNFYSGIRVSSLSKFEPKALKYTAAHTLDLYSEVAAICRPPLVLAPNESGSFKKTQTPATGYIISVFKVFEGDDGERFEKNWLYWTGARMLYRYLPRAAGLRRIALHKSTSQRGDKMYLLVCECADLLKDISSAAFLIPALRARLCGYTGLYKPIQVF